MNKKELQNLSSAITKFRDSIFKLEASINRQGTMVDKLASTQMKSANVIAEAIGYKVKGSAGRMVHRSSEGIRSVSNENIGERSLIDSVANLGDLVEESKEQLLNSQDSLMQSSSNMMTAANILQESSEQNVTAISRMSEKFIKSTAYLGKGLYATGETIVEGTGKAMGNINREVGGSEAWDSFKRNVGKSLALSFGGGFLPLQLFSIGSGVAGDIGKMAKKVGSHLPGIPGLRKRKEGYDSFEDGGVVPGKKGEPKNITAHGGELILSTKMQEELVEKMNEMTELLSSIDKSLKTEFELLQDAFFPEMKKATDEIKKGFGKTAKTIGTMAITLPKVILKDIMFDKIIKGIMAFTTQRLYSSDEFLASQISGSSRVRKMTAIGGVGGAGIGVGISSILGSSLGVGGLAGGLVGAKATNFYAKVMNEFNNIERKKFILMTKQKNALETIVDLLGGINQQIGGFWGFFTEKLPLPLRMLVRGPGKIAGLGRKMTRPLISTKKEKMQRKEELQKIEDLKQVNLLSRNNELLEGILRVSKNQYDILEAMATFQAESPFEKEKIRNLVKIHTISKKTLEEEKDQTGWMRLSMLGLGNMISSFLRSPFGLLLMGVGLGKAFVDYIGNPFGTIMETIARGAGPGIEFGKTVGKAASHAAKPIVNLGKNIGSYLSKFFGSAANMGDDAVMSTGRKILSTNTVLRILGSASEQLTDILRNLPGIGKLLGEKGVIEGGKRGIWETVASGAKSALKGTGKAIMKGLPFLNFGVTTGTSLYEGDNLGRSVSRGAGATIGASLGALGFAGGPIGILTSIIGGFLGELFGGLAYDLITGFTGIGKWVKDTASGILGRAKDLLKSLISPITDPIFFVIDKIKSIATWFKDSVSGIIDTVKSHIPFGDWIFGEDEKKEPGIKAPNELYIPEKEISKVRREPTSMLRLEEIESLSEEDTNFYLENLRKRSEARWSGDSEALSKLEAEQKDRLKNIERSREGYLPESEFEKYPDLQRNQFHLKRGMIDLHTGEVERDPAKINAKIYEIGMEDGRKAQTLKKSETGLLRDYDMSEIRMDQPSVQRFKEEPGINPPVSSIGEDLRKHRKGYGSLSEEEMSELKKFENEIFDYSTLSLQELNEISELSQKAVNALLEDDWRVYLEYQRKRLKRYREFTEGNPNDREMRKEGIKTSLRMTEPGVPPIHFDDVVETFQPLERTLGETRRVTLGIQKDIANIDKTLDRSKSTVRFTPPTPTGEWTVTVDRANSGSSMFFVNQYMTGKGGGLNPNIPAQSMKSEEPGVSTEETPDMSDIPALRELPTPVSPIEKTVEEIKKSQSPTAPLEDIKKSQAPSLADEIKKAQPRPESFEGGGGTGFLPGTSMTPETFSRLFERLKEKEGFSSTPYRLKGEEHDTIGYGFYNTGLSHITREDANKRLEEEIRERTKFAKRDFPDFEQFPPDRKIALMDLYFNMGQGWTREFKNAYSNMRQGNWETGAEQLLLNSKGGPSKYLQDVKGRAHEVVDLLKGSANISMPDTDMEPLEQNAIVSMQSLEAEETRRRNSEAMEAQSMMMSDNFKQASEDMKHNVINFMTNNSPMVMGGNNVRNSGSSMMSGSGQQGGGGTSELDFALGMPDLQEYMEGLEK